MSEDQLDSARRRFQDAVSGARDGVRRHSGLRLGPAWVLPLVAAAAGMTAAWALRKRLRLTQGDGDEARN